MWRVLSVRSDWLLVVCHSNFGDMSIMASYMYSNQKKSGRKFVITCFCSCSNEATPLRNSELWPYIENATKAVHRGTISPLCYCSCNIEWHPWELLHFYSGHLVELNSNSCSQSRAHDSQSVCACPAERFPIWSLRIYQSRVCRKCSASVSC